MSRVIEAFGWPTIRCTGPHHVGPHMTAELAAVWRRSCGVMVGNVWSASWQLATAVRNTRARQLEFLSTPPRRSVKTSSSRALPVISAASSSASADGKGRERRSRYGPVTVSQLSQDAKGLVARRATPSKSRDTCDTETLPHTASRLGPFDGFGLLSGPSTVSAMSVKV